MQGPFGWRDGFKRCPPLRHFIPRHPRSLREGLGHPSFSPFLPRCSILSHGSAPHSCNPYLPGGRSYCSTGCARKRPSTAGGRRQALCPGAAATCSPLVAWQKCCCRACWLTRPSPWAQHPGPRAARRTPGAWRRLRATCSWTAPRSRGGGEAAPKREPACLQCCSPLPRSCRFSAQAQSTCCAATHAGLPTLLTARCCSSPVLQAHAPA